jgi:hypothetical protein
VVKGSLLFYGAAVYKTRNLDAYLSRFNSAAKLERNIVVRNPGARRRSGIEIVAATPLVHVAGGFLATEAATAFFASTGTLAASAE